MMPLIDPLTLFMVLDHRSELERCGVAQWHQVVAAVGNWWDKYRVTLRDIEAERNTAAKQLDESLGV